MTSSVVGTNAVSLPRPQVGERQVQRPLKVLVVRALLSMAQALTTQGIEVGIFGVEHQSAVLSDEALCRSVTIHLKDLPFRRSIRSTMTIVYSVAKILRQEQPQIIHVNAIGDLIAISMAMRAALPRSLRPKVVVMSHSPMTWTSAGRARIAGKLISHFANGVVCLTQANAAQVRSIGFPSSKVVAIPNSFDADQTAHVNVGLNSEGEIRETSQNIVYVASICKRKAQDVLIRAAHEVIRVHPTSHFYLVGKPISGEEEYARSLEVLIQELGLSGHVHFTGSLPYKETLDCLANAAVVAFPTLGEMMPRAVIEAMKMGKPIAASAVDGITDLIVDNETGILVPPGRHQELAHAICTFLDDPLAAKAIGLAAEISINERCSPTRVGRQYRDFYELVTGG